MSRRTAHSEATQDRLSEGERSALALDGFVVLRDVLSGPEVAAIIDAVEARVAMLRASDPLFRVGGTLHVDELVEHHPNALRPIVDSPRLAAAVAELLGAPGALGRLHFRGPLSGEGAQALHGDAGRTHPAGTPADSVTVIVALVDFTEENGATRVLPGSHRHHPPVPKESGRAVPGQVTITCPAGSAIVFDAALVHSGQRNRGTTRRDALQISYLRG